MQGGGRRLEAALVGGIGAADQQSCQRNQYGRRAITASSCSARGRRVRAARKRIERTLGTKEAFGRMGWRLLSFFTQRQPASTSDTLEIDRIRTGDCHTGGTVALGSIQTALSFRLESALLDTGTAPVGAGTENPRVGGSTPSLGTNTFDEDCDSSTELTIDIG